VTRPKSGVWTAVGPSGCQVAVAAVCADARGGVSYDQSMAWGEAALGEETLGLGDARRQTGALRDWFGRSAEGCRLRGGGEGWAEGCEREKPDAEGDDGSRFKLR